MAEFAYDLKIPKDRVAVLIGKKGETKKQLEESTRCTFAVDSKEGDVHLSGEDSVRLFIAREIVLAIGRGFNPEVAQLLLKQDYGIEVLPLNDYARSQNDMIRLRGRIIGEGGKSRRVIEELTETHICVYGKTVSIVGELHWLSLARKAIEALLDGATHASVYKMLEKKRKTIKRMIFDSVDVKEDNHGTNSRGTE